MKAAQAAAAAAIADQDFVDQSARHNAGELKRVSAAIQKLGYDVTESACNFVLVHFTDEDTAQAADANFRKHGLIVRAVGVYGLPKALRISIGAVEQNNAMLAAFKSFASK